METHYLKKNKKLTQAGFGASRFRFHRFLGERVNFKRVHDGLL
jgi:hypothetical protein